jgi:hypothetical protein
MVKKLVLLYLTHYKISMKKILPVLLISMILIVSSCTQEYICQCSIKYTGNPPGLPDSSVVEFKIRDKKKEAIKNCEANSTTSTKDGITFIEKCRIY